MIKRDLHLQFEKRMFSGKAIIVLGPRQSGKTTVVKDFLAKRKESVLQLNGDDADVRALFANATVAKMKLIVQNNKILFIDEAQRIDSIGLALKIFTDQIKDVQIIATGSSALELATGIKEPLTGRMYEYFLYPLSFSELSNHFGVLDENRDLEKRLLYGSYPEIVTHLGEEVELLKLLASSYLYKDLLAIQKINKPALLDKILKALAFQMGKEVSYSELGKTVGADNETVERYIDLLEKCFVVFKLQAFSRNHRGEIKKSKKVFFWDNGVRNAIIGNFLPVSARQDLGALWENYLISERMKLLNYGSMPPFSYFWRTLQQQEIDYVEDRNGQLYAYEFKWNKNKTYRFPKTFKNTYPDAETKLINQENYIEWFTEKL